MKLKSEKHFLSIQDMSLIALFAAFISACSFIQLSIGPVPFTLQTFGIFVSAGILGARRGTISVIVYVLLGLVGLPVFAGAFGPGVIVGPTGGYITGFIFTALIIGLITQYVKSKNTAANIAISIAAMVLGDLVCFVLGTIQFMYVSGNNLAVSLSYCVTPFVIPDFVKIVVATIIVNRLKKYVSKVFN